jgi:hypothetical protein
MEPTEPLFLCLRPVKLEAPDLLGALERLEELVELGPMETQAVTAQEV